ncbi:MAG: DUF4198 domain-containing protein [Sphingomonas sp.]|nr:DUF4198 domain-containing protein [Sphingomonas sp.]
MKKFFLTGLLVFAATPALAHDFWIQPLSFQVGEGQPLTATFQVGHGQYRQRWGNDIRRIPLLVDISVGGRTDQRAQVRSDASADFVGKLGRSGLHVLAMQTSTAFSDLPAVRFNDYLKAEGLTLPIAVRARNKSTALPGRERYTRRAKALIQVGTQTPASTVLATRPIGMKLEIVPEKNPYMLDRARRLPVYVLYKGKRLPNASVRLTSLEFDARPLESEITDRAGRATFTVPAVGSWLINVIWSEPISNDAKADFETTFSSLTFGYDPARRSR